MANEEHVRILKQGVETWNKWRIKNKQVRPDISGVDIRGAKLSGANLSGAYLSRAYLRDADLRDADLSRAYISHADLRCADLRGSDLRGSDLNRAILIGAYLSDAQLRGANLNCADLHDADLHDADLSDTNLREADLTGADLRDVDLRDADLSDADLTGVDLREADLSEANLTGTNLKEADLREADLNEGLISRTTFANLDLSSVKGLGNVRHLGPSTIGIDTLYKSEGKIPETFLRGCGVPDDFITYARSLVTKSIEFYSCFISYSHRDEDFARRLHSRMRDEHLRVWFAPEDVKGGEKLHEQIERAIQLHDRLLIVLSDNSIHSEWVMTEIRRARKAEIKEKRRKLFPIRLVDFDTIREWECFDADTGKDLALELREYFIPDFTNWKDHDRFEAGFKRLLRDLRQAEDQEEDQPLE